MKKRIQNLGAIILVLILIFTGCSLKNADENKIEVNSLPDNLSSDDLLEIYFVDVGQGDCIFLRSESKTMLIDSGTPENSTVICDLFEKLGVEKLDYFIGTHPHRDHLGGISGVIQKYGCGKVYLTGDTSNAFFFEKFLDTLESKSITPEIIKTGCRYRNDDFSYEFLSPEIDFEDTNNNSIVTRVDFGNTSMLLTGDAEKEVEHYLVENHKNIRADILKVGHHGSENASTEEFLEAVNPSLSVIQCGRDNSYGHPHRDVLERLENAGSEIYRCDEMGTILFISDGENIYKKDGEIIPENKKPEIEENKAENNAINENEGAPVAEEENLYIGNINSKKFHVGKCRSLPIEKNRRYFKTREEALEAGYSPCKSCNP